MAHIDEDAQDELREGFAAISKGKTQIDQKSFAELLRWLGQNPNGQEVNDMWAQAGGGATLSQESFVQWMSKQFAETRAKEDVVEAFSVFDKDGRGMISASDLRFVLTGMGDKLDEDQVEEMLRASVGSGEGALRYEEFVGGMYNR